MNKKELEWSGGGTKDSPYLIESYEDLEALSQKVGRGKSFEGVYFTLTADIDMTDRIWSAIGNNTNKFLGDFDGNFKTISNMKLDEKGINGLFGCLGAKEESKGSVRNLTIKAADMDIPDDSTMFGLLAGSNYGEITGCTCEGTLRISRTKEAERLSAGLVAGMNQSQGMIQDCMAKGMIYVTGGDKTLQEVGGVAGWNTAQASMLHCSMEGDMEGVNYLAGVCGVNSGILQDCCYKGNMIMEAVSFPALLVPVTKNEGENGLSIRYGQTEHSLRTAVKAKPQIKANIGKYSVKINAQTYAKLTITLGPEKEKESMKTGGTICISKKTPLFLGKESVSFDEVIMEKDAFIWIRDSLDFKAKTFKIVDKLSEEEKQAALRNAADFGAEGELSEPLVPGAHIIVMPKVQPFTRPAESGDDGRNGGNGGSGFVGGDGGSGENGQDGVCGQDGAGSLEVNIEIENLYQDLVVANVSTDGQDGGNGGNGGNGGAGGKGAWNEGKGRGGRGGDGGNGGNGGDGGNGGNGNLVKIHCRTSNQSQVNPLVLTGKGGTAGEGGEKGAGGQGAGRYAGIPSELDGIDGRDGAKGRNGQNGTPVLMEIEVVEEKEPEEKEPQEETTEETSGEKEAPETEEAKKEAEKEAWEEKDPGEIRRKKWMDQFDELLDGKLSLKLDFNNPEHEAFFLECHGGKEILKTKCPHVYSAYLKSKTDIKTANNSEAILGYCAYPPSVVPNNQGQRDQTAGEEYCRVNIRMTTDVKSSIDGIVMSGFVEDSFTKRVHASIYEELNSKEIQANHYHGAVNVDEVLYVNDCQGFATKGVIDYYMKDTNSMETVIVKSNPSVGAQISEMIESFEVLAPRSYHSPANNPVWIVYKDRYDSRADYSYKDVSPVNRWVKTMLPIEGVIKLKGQFLAGEYPGLETYDTKITYADNKPAYFGYEHQMGDYFQKEGLQQIRFTFPVEWKGEMDSESYGHDVNTFLSCPFYYTIIDPDEEGDRKNKHLPFSITSEIKLSPGQSYYVTKEDTNAFVPPIRYVWGCMGKDTKIRMGDNTMKLISEIKKGDLVWVYQHAPMPVQQVITGTEDTMIHIQTVNGSSLLLTDKHPVLTKRGTVSADKLNAADILILPDGGESMVDFLYDEEYQDQIYCLDLGESHMLCANGLLAGDYQCQNHTGNQNEKAELNPETEAFINEMRMLRTMLN